jgi:hypothetical protein
MVPLGNFGKMKIMSEKFSVNEVGYYDSWGVQ